jgi:hypothetical protein
MGDIFGLIGFLTNFSRSRVKWTEQHRLKQPNWKEQADGRVPSGERGDRADPLHRLKGR